MQGKVFMTGHKIDRKVIAVLTADWHLSQSAPAARMAEPDWFAAMLRPIGQIETLAFKHDAPVIIAGDLFDRCKVPHVTPELINFALVSLSAKYYAVPGQHDLPNHSYADIRKSPYWTLEATDTINHLYPGRPVEINGMKLYGFPFGFPVTPLEKPFDLFLNIAVVHAYIWKSGTGYPGASTDTRLAAYKEKLRGYDIAVFGDNHIPFDAQLSHGCRVHNSGPILRRKIDERDYKPSVGMLYNDGTIERHYLDCSADKFVDAAELVHAVETLVDENMTEFLKELENLGDVGINFREAVVRFLDELSVSGSLRVRVLNMVDGGGK